MEMRRAEKEIKDPAWCRGVLEKVAYLVLALNDGGAPYAVPLCVALDGEAIYLHMATAGHKLDLLTSDPRAGFAAVGHAEVMPGETICATGMRAFSVAGSAHCAVVSDPTERRRALDAFARKYTGTTPAGYPPETFAATIVVRLDLVRISGRCSG